MSLPGGGPQLSGGHGGPPSAEPPSAPGAGRPSGELRGAGRWEPRGRTADQPPIQPSGQPVSSRGEPPRHGSSRARTAVVIAVVWLALTAALVAVALLLGLADPSPPPVNVSSLGTWLPTGL